MSTTMVYFLFISVIWCQAWATEDYGDVITTSYEGCWYLESDQFGVWGPWTADLTVDTCREYCEQMGFQLFALKAGVECSCGDEITDSAYRALEATCNTPCGGNPHTICGGDASFSIWRCDQVIAGHEEVQRVNARVQVSSCNEDLRSKIYDATLHALQNELKQAVEVSFPKYCIQEDSKLEIPLTVSVRYTGDATDLATMSTIHDSFEDDNSVLCSALRQVDANLTVISVSQVSYPCADKSSEDGRLVILYTILRVMTLSLLVYVVYKVYGNDIRRRLCEQNPDPSYYHTQEYPGENVPLTSVYSGNAYDNSPRKF